MHAKMPACGSMLMVFAVCLCAHGDAIYNDGGVHDLSAPLSDTVVLQNCLGLPTTLRVQNGGSVMGACKPGSSGSQAVGVSVTSSTLSIEGGGVTSADGDRSYGVDATDGSVTILSGSVSGGSCVWTAGIRATRGTVCIKGGSVSCGGGIIRQAVSGSAAVTIQGGTITGDVNGASLDISGGDIAGNLKASGGSAKVVGGTIVGNLLCGGAGNIGGGKITGNITGGAAPLDVYAGTILGNLCSGAGATTLRGSASVTGNVVGGTGRTTITGGNVKGCVQGGEGGVDIYGGNIQGSDSYWNYGILAGTGATVNLYGGNITVSDKGMWDYGVVCEGGRVNIYGGTIAFGGKLDDAGWSSALRAMSGAIYLYGTFDNRDYGPIWSTYGTISGTLQDGTRLTELSFYQNSPGQIVLASSIPEPATMTLLVLGATALLRWRKWCA